MHQHEVIHAILAWQIYCAMLTAYDTKWKLAQGEVGRKQYSKYYQSIQQ